MIKQTKKEINASDIPHFCLSSVQHFRLFPKSLGDVLAAYHVQELHLTQTQGKWRHQSWGYPVEDAPSGAQLWVWFKPTVTEYVLDLFVSFVGYELFINIFIMF